MTANRTVVACSVCILIAIGLLAYVTLHDHGSLKDYVHAESVQRVTTIGERCESQLHQANEYGRERDWFLRAHKKCLVSLAKVEARAHTQYKPLK